MTEYPLSVPTIGPEEIDAATEVLRSGKTTMGEKVEQFEEAFARKVGASHAIMVNSGSSANLLAAYGADLASDQQVIVPAVTWPTQVWPWEQAGSTVKFCDVDQINTTIELVLERATNKTRAVSIPHLMGVPVPRLLDLVKETNWLLHEDCCEALGARIKGRSVGTWADVATWSFFFSHQMTTMEGGMVTTSHRDFDRKIRSLRSHGWNRHFSKDRYTFHDEGFNLRPTEVQAAIGLVQLSKLAGMNEQRSLNYIEFERKLCKHPNITLPTVPPEAEPSWFGVAMLVQEGRDELAKHLEEEGVETRPILGGNLKNQPGFRGFYFNKTPGADRVSEQGLFVGLHPFPDSGAAEVAKLIGDFS